MPIQWSDELKLGIKEIDDQHRTFIGIVDELHQAVQEEALNRQLKPILDKLEGYARFHFATEELYFQKFGCADTKDHIAQHRWMAEKVDEFVRRYDRQKEDIVGELVYFLGDWLSNHLKTMDMKYVDCFKKNGVN